MKKSLILVSIVLFLVGATIVVRTARFGSKQIQQPPVQEIVVDKDAIAKRLSEAIRYRTVSYQHETGAGTDTFHDFHEFLERSFPRIHATLMKEVVGGSSLLYRWQGNEQDLKPILLMGHMDVVPVDFERAADWSYPPFSGRLADGFIWGRGTLDDKVGVLGVLEAVELLLQKGFQPRRTIYLAFGHDEEVGGQNGAAQIAALLRSRNTELEFVLDEGGTLLEGMLPETTAPVALVGVAEKGYLSLELTVEAPGGHSSMPPEQTAIGILSAAIYRLEQDPFPAKITAATRKLFDYLGPELGWPEKIGFANLWLFGPLVERRLASSPLTNGLIRTTTAATLFEAGVKDNVLPTKARAVVNVRILTGETASRALDRVGETIRDPRVKIAPLSPAIEPSPVSSVESSGFKLLHQTVSQTFPGAIVAPSLLVAATDSRHYARLTPNIFRFLPITLQPEDTRRFHGTDERISVENYKTCVRFFVRLIRNGAA